MSNGNNNATPSQTVLVAYDCPKCWGLGNFRCWGHIAGGDCFTCGGEGKIHATRDRAEHIAARRKAYLDAAQAPVRHYVRSRDLYAQTRAALRAGESVDVDTVIESAEHHAVQALVSFAKRIEIVNAFRALLGRPLLVMSADGNSAGLPR